MLGHEDALGFSMAYFLLIPIVLICIFRMKKYEWLLILNITFSCIFIFMTAKFSAILFLPLSLLTIIMFGLSIIVGVNYGNES